MKNLVENSNKAEKIIEYDVVRAIATLLVVIGHCYYYTISTKYGGCDYSSFVGDPCIVLQLFHKLKVVIYIFHMPLFFALSGALFKKKFNRGGIILY